MFPLSVVVLEEPPVGDAKSPGHAALMKWALQWFCESVKQSGMAIIVKQGDETYQLRQQYRLLKTRRKDEVVFTAHCVDSWVLAASVVGGRYPDTVKVMRVVPFQFLRRQLHHSVPIKGQDRVKVRIGGMCRNGMRCGMYVRHRKLGDCYIASVWTADGKLRLHSLRTGQLAGYAKPAACKVLTYASFITFMRRRRNYEKKERK